MSIHIYNTAFQTLLAGNIASARVCLVTSAYEFDAAHTTYNDIAAAELSTGGGYTAGGQALENVTITGGSGAGVRCGGCTWQSLSATFRYAIAMDGNQQLLWCYLLDETSADITIQASNYTLALPEDLLVGATFTQSS